MITVTLFPPSIDREVVRFGWQTSHPIAHQPGRAFEQRYEGVDLAWFAPELFLEIFLAFELKALSAVEGRVRLILPSPVPAPVADFWRGWNDAWNVEIEPISPATSYDPWAVSPAIPIRRKRWGVFFGGGKDSSFVTQVLREVAGPDDVLLLRGILNSVGGPVALDRRYGFDESLILEPNRRAFGFPTARYHTTYPQTLRPDVPAARPHRELHTAGALPLLLAHGIDTAAICLEWSGFLTSVAEAPPPHHRPSNFRSGAPYLASQSRHYQATHGSGMTITNPLGSLSFSTVYHLLTARYPAATRTSVSCEQQSTARWCGACFKCLRAGLYMLGAGLFDPDYDFEHALLQTERTRAIVAAAQLAPAPGRNAPWTPAMNVVPGHLPELLDNIARIDLDRARARLTPAATETLTDIVRGLGNVRYPYYLQISRAAVAHLPAHVRDVFLPVAAAHLDVVADTPDIVDPTGAVWAMPWRYDVALPTGMPG